MFVIMDSQIYVIENVRVNLSILGFNKERSRAVENKDDVKCSMCSS
jgi:hypothetical protein